MNANKESQSFGYILVVDDEETMRRSLADILRLEGYRVKAVSDGQAALDALRAQARITAAKPVFGQYSVSQPASPSAGNFTGGFDVILLDLKMPGVDGLEVLKAASRIAPDTMIILLTAHGSLESAIEAIHYKAHDYLLKPASPQQIINSVTKAIGRRAELLHKQALLEQKRAAQNDQADHPGHPSARPLPSALPGANSKPTISSPSGSQPPGQGIWQHASRGSQAIPFQGDDPAFRGEQSLLEPRLIALSNNVVVDLARREVWRLDLSPSGSPSEDHQKQDRLRSVSGQSDSPSSGKQPASSPAKVRLTPTEGKLLKVLLENRGRVLTHRELVLMVQGYEVTDWEAPEVLRPLVSRLRQKLKLFPGGESWIVNVRGTGYVLERRQKDHGPTAGVERRQTRRV